jgi:hypothetical protein
MSIEKQASSEAILRTAPQAVAAADQDGKIDRLARRRDENVNCRKTPMRCYPTESMDSTASRAP